MSTLMARPSQSRPQALRRAIRYHLKTNGLVALGGAGSGNFGHAGRPGEVGGSGEGGADSEVPKSFRVVEDGDLVDGRTVINADNVPNTSSISSSLSEHTVLKGIREVPMSAFTLTGKHYSASGQQRIDELADAIKLSGEITPLIVVHDKEGLYILEGATRADALFNLGAKSFPALVVEDTESLSLKSNAHIHTNVARKSKVKSPWRFDPTRTTTLRQRWVKEMNRRFAKLKASINENVGRRDVLGLAPLQHGLKGLGGAGSGNFGHEGRPGEVGGSGSGGSAPSATAPKGRVYHGTSEKKWERIKRAGIKPSGGFAGTAVYSTKSLNEATTFARNAALNDGSEKFVIISTDDKDFNKIGFTQYTNRSVVKADRIKDVWAYDYFHWSEDAPTPAVKVNVDLPERAYAFDVSDVKMEKFMDWLDEEVSKGILDTTTGPRRARMASAGTTRWTDTYIQSAYKRGIANANNAMGTTGVDVVATPEAALLPSRDPVQAAFLSPINADKVATLYGRTFEDLRGITRSMSSAIGRSLAESVAEGRSPWQTAQILNKRVDGIGLTRARMLARTETIRAQHVGNINTYRAAGVEGVVVVAEWKATDDDRVCDDCAEMDGKQFTLDAIEGLIPLHPNCRCAALPVVDEGKGFGEVTDEDGNVLENPTEAEL